MGRYPTPLADAQSRGRVLFDCAGRSGGQLAFNLWESARFGGIVAHVVVSQSGESRSVILGRSELCDLAIMLALITEYPPSPAGLVETGEVPTGAPARFIEDELPFAEDVQR